MRQGMLGLILAMQTTISDSREENCGLRCTSGLCEGRAQTRFNQRKSAVLESISCGVDKSKKGSFDAPISAMLEHINNHPAYVTTSSCSGRIALFLESTTDHGHRSKGGDWLLCEHAETTSQDVKHALANVNNRNGLVYFKHEPFIMHVQCRSLEDACNLLDVAKNAGYRESGISPGKKNTMVAVRTSSLKMDIPVVKDGALLVSSEYIDEIVRIANEKFVKNRKRSDDFYTLMKRELLCGIQDPDAGTVAPSAELPPLPPAQSSEITTQSSAWTVVCSGAECEEIRKMLIEVGWLDRSRRNVKLDSGKIAIPITNGGRACIEAGEEDNDLAAALKANRIELQSQGQGPASGKGTSVSRHAKLRQVLAELLQLVVDEAVAATMLAGIPRHWEEYGDLILLPEGAFSSDMWAKAPREQLWERVARGLGVQRLAQKAEVDEGPMRQSHVKLLYPPAGGDGWVNIVQNGIQYTWDVTRVMFSRGNVNERRRMGEVGCCGETVVDLFAGIGYFTVPVLAQGKAARVYACEWNPDSVEALRRNLRLNGVEERCEVLVGDNQESAGKVWGLICS